MSKCLSQTDPHPPPQITKKEVRGIFRQDIFPNSQAGEYVGLRICGGAEAGEREGEGRRAFSRGASEPDVALARFISGPLARWSRDRARLIRAGGGWSGSRIGCPLRLPCGFRQPRPERPGSRPIKAALSRAPVSSKDSAPAIPAGRLALPPPLRSALSVNGDALRASFCGKLALCCFCVGNVFAPPPLRSSGRRDASTSRGRDRRSRRGSHRRMP